MFKKIIFRNERDNNWIEFFNPVEHFDIYQLAEVLPAIRTLEAHVNNRELYAAGFISYEAAPAFDKACEVKFDPGFPLLRFGLFREMRTLDTLDTAPSILEQEWQMDSAPEYYSSKIQNIKNRIFSGDTYQVNFTVRQHTKDVESAWSLFHQLGAESPYSAYIECDDWAICSASPELFFELDGNHLCSRPMKGTAPRGATVRDDEQQKSWLRNSEKNRAENLMIVDMIRNDMGRVAIPGSISVENLFRVETYPTVLQMTSSVSSQTYADISEILSALFPCASITGAPKINTMRTIAEIEDSPRRIYTGTLGYFLPNRKARFNVAIRTALVNQRNNSACYGVGGGIVWDSQAHEEMEEVETKSQILGKASNRHYFNLLESILWTGEDYFLLEKHIQRLVKSSEFFRFKFRDENLFQHLEDLRKILPTHPSKVRVLVNHQGKTESGYEKLSLAEVKPVTVSRACFPVDNNCIWLTHKTTIRTLYDEAMALSGGTDDVLLWNINGLLTESSIANIAIKADGKWLTPRSRNNLLPGVFRAHLLTQDMLCESDIYLDSCNETSEIFLLNSVRKWIPVDKCHLATQMADYPTNQNKNLYDSTQH